MELLTNAWMGWLRYTDDGKYAALLLLVLLFLWYSREEKEGILLLYGTIAAGLCIFPVSAAFLMLYQTRFYDYEWIWNYVPVTLLIAYGGTLFLYKYTESVGNRPWKRVGLWLAVGAVVFLCGSMGQERYGESSGVQERKAAQQVLSRVMSESHGNGICLWAPSEIMETARAYDGNIRLIYGRNIWDAALGAYSYDVYGEAEETLCHWMTRIEESSMQGHFANEPTTEEIVEGGAQMLEKAAGLGADTVLLPGKIALEDMQSLAKISGTEPVQIGDYYLLRLTNE